MKTEILYNQTNEIEKHNAAIKDCQNYLGDRWFKFIEYLKTCEKMQDFEIACSFVGIQGYPVKALRNHLFPL